MQLGSFSVSLAVKDIQKSLDFYAALGFEQRGGDTEQGWAILKNGDTLIGLFQDMFERNMLTFNPGWNQNAEHLDSFTDVRDLQKALQDKGLTLETTIEDGSEGPAHIMLTDPDGNPILIDQHR